MTGADPTRQLRPVTDEVPAPRTPGEPTQLPAAGTSPRTSLGAVREILDAGGPALVFQPQLSLARSAVAGYEALARFPGETIQGPERWFELAHHVGLGPELEAAALAQALNLGRNRPIGTALAVNLSPSVLGTAALDQVLPSDLSGLEIELTEHERVPDPIRLRRELDRLRERGARVAIDDVGAGHSGLVRVMELAPDSLKLDRHLVVGVAHSTAKAALIRAVVDFAEHLGATVCAEGVEDLDDLLTLADLDVGLAQGWAVGMPHEAFQDAEPDAVVAGLQSLRGVLASDGGRGPASRRPGTPPTTEEVLARLTEVTDLATLAAIAEGSDAALGCERVVLSFVHADGTAVEAVGDEGGVGEPAERFLIEDYPITRQCLTERTVLPVYRDDPGGGEECRLLERLGFGTVLLVPIVSRDRAVGLLECYLTDVVPWSRRQIRSARLLAAMLGPVLDGLLTERARRPAVQATTRTLDLRGH